MPMKFKTTQQGTVTVIRLEGNLMGGPDAATLNEKLHASVAAGKVRVVLDLTAVDFMNSSGLSILIGGAGLLKNANGKLVLAEASPKIASLFKITKLGSVFEQFPTVEEAVAELKKK
jgi:anti-sigma B factor antagonist